MLTTFWSVKGGVGVSSVAAMAALARAGRAEPSLLIDLCGDLPALLGVADPVDPGISEWCATPDRSAAALERIATEINVDLALIHQGSAPWPAHAAGLAQAFDQQTRDIYVDAGLAPESFHRDLIERSDHRILVLRCCYLALRAARNLDPRPTGIVLVRERSRALGPGDAEAVTGAPVVAEIAIDPAVARCIDAGLSTTRLPRGLLRSLANAALHV